MPFPFSFQLLQCIATLYYKGELALIITIVCDVLGKENNGTTVAAVNLIRALKSYGHEVRVLCGNEDRLGMPGYYVTRNIKLIPPLDNYVSKVGVEISAPESDIIRQALQGTDIVHIMTPFLLGTASLRIAKNLNLPVTAGFHCQAENLTSHFHMMNVPFANKITYHSMYDIFYRHVDCIHYPTQFIRDIFESHVGETYGVVISNGVSSLFQKKPSARPPQFDGKFLILCIGRFAPEKSQDVLLDAIRLSSHEKDIQVILAGQGPLYDKLKEQGASLTNPPVMKLFQREELPDVINYCDLYTHPADVDLEAIACLEAISCGLVPVIANSPRCATKNFALTDNNLFEVNDSVSLAEKIDYWIDQPGKREEASKKYLEFAKQFRLEDCMKKMEQLMLDVLAARS